MELCCSDLFLRCGFLDLGIVVVYGFGCRSIGCVIWVLCLCLCWFGCLGFLGFGFASLVQHRIWL